MNRIIRLTLFVLSPLLCCFQCEKESPYVACAPEEIQAVTTQEIAPVHFTPQANTRLETRAFQVNSLAELTAIVPADQLQGLNIDFALYTLVGGVSHRSGGISVTSQQVTQDCRDGYTYSARLADSPTLSPTNLLFGVLIPKLPKGTMISYELQAYE
ncbi:hypothetical protein MTX78_12185 [Hymenobacter tibetensis]|uniref:PrcB C-terminal domain-containing protein n=1 Tax=Hymenobacter tibetensis TaxID=497967 RepID=A0ABY4CS19_9BACT|nr:hypothetical protein [Hymenobacter tibetensis]UOG72887.1 hypothetical protein MTX78_12185 [Hymenobacter tibetensis]